MSDCGVVSIQEAARRLDIHRSTAYALARKGPPWGIAGRFPVPVIKVGNQLRVSLEVLEFYIRTGELPDEASSGR